MADKLNTSLLSSVIQIGFHTIVPWIPKERAKIPGREDAETTADLITVLINCEDFLHSTRDCLMLTFYNKLLLLQLLQHGKQTYLVFVR